MAEGDVRFYNSFLAKVNHSTYANSLTWDNTNFTIILVSGYTPDIDSDVDVTDVNSFEFSTGGGYTAGTKTLASKTITQDNANNRALFDCADITWTSLTLSGTPSHAVIYDTTNELLQLYIVIGTTATNGADYTLAISSSPACLFHLKDANS